MTLRILVADDHEVVRRGLREILREAFAEARVEESVDVGSTRAAVEAGEWDLVLLDLSMPGGEGLELLKEIKRRRPETRVLVLTMAAETAYAVQSIQAGAAGFVNKRDAADELVVAVRRVLEGQSYLSRGAMDRVAAGLRGDAQVRPHERLSPREFEVFRRIALGRSVKEISGELELSEKTVATYLERIREKTGLRTPVEIARYAMREGLVDA